MWDTVKIFSSTFLSIPHKIHIWQIPNNKNDNFPKNDICEKKKIAKQINFPKNSKKREILLWFSSRLQLNFVLFVVSMACTFQSCQSSIKCWNNLNIYDLEERNRPRSTSTRRKKNNTTLCEREILYKKNMKIVRWINKSGCLCGHKVLENGLRSSRIAYLTMTWNHG